MSPTARLPLVVVAVSTLFWPGCVSESHRRSAGGPVVVIPVPLPAVVGASDGVRVDDGSGLDEAPGDRVVTSTIGCPDSAHASLALGVAAAQEDGHEQVFVCEGEYVEDETIDIYTDLAVVTDPHGEGVVVDSTAVPVFAAEGVSRELPPIEVALGAMEVRCPTFSRDRYGPTLDSIGLELYAADLSLHHVDWMGCGVGVLRADGLATERLAVHGGAFVDGGHAMYLWGDGLELEVVGTIFEGLSDEAFALSPDARDGTAPAVYSFDDVTVVDNAIHFGGALFSMQCLADAGPELEVRNSRLVRNISTLEDWGGAGGVFYVGSGCSAATVYVEDSVVAANRSATTDAGAATVYAGRFVSVDTDWGETGTAFDNRPVDINFGGVVALRDIDGVASFDCTAGHGGYCE